MSAPSRAVTFPEILKTPGEINRDCVNRYLRSIAFDLHMIAGNLSTGGNQQYIDMDLQRVKRMISHVSQLSSLSESKERQEKIAALDKGFSEIKKAASLIDSINSLRDLVQKA